MGLANSAGVVIFHHETTGHIAAIGRKQTFKIGTLIIRC